MTRQTVSPSKRLLMAALGYLLIYLGPMWMNRGGLVVLAGVSVYAVYALLLLRIAGTGLVRADEPKDETHPVQAGKQPLLRRGRQMAWARA